MPPKTKASDLIKEVRQNVNNGMTPAEARKTVRGIQSGPIQPTVSANEIANPPAKVTPPVPEVNTNTGARTDGMIESTTANTDGFIQSQSENAQKRDELAQLLGTQTFDAAGQRAGMMEDFGVTEDTKRLKDIQTQLAKRNTQTELQKAQATEGGAGAIQAQRALTLADKQAAIRDAGLAAEANVLQGNIETASTLINNAMQDYYSDRTLKNQNMIQQLEYFSGIADAETKQLLDKETRKYEEDQKKVERTLDAVDAAVTSGAATPDEIKLLTDPKTTDEDRTTLAQGITARAAKSLYDANLYGKYLSNAIAQKELDALNAPVDETAIPPETLKTVKGLTDGQRTTITDSRETINEVQRMIALVESAGDMSLLTKATEEGREFLRLRQNVVDKLARKRTGAVIGVEEEKTFKDILGVGMFDLIAKDDEEVVKGLKKFVVPHEEAINLNDPTGEVRNFLDASKVDDGEIDTIWGIGTGVTEKSNSSYFK